jgi:hypothetical protein
MRHSAFAIFVEQDFLVFCYTGTSLFRTGRTYAGTRVQNSPYTTLASC